MGQPIGINEPFRIANTGHPRSVMSTQTTWCLPASTEVATFQAVESRLPERPGDCARGVTLTRGPKPLKIIVTLQAADTWVSRLSIV
jgi:hypothetical protein